MASKYVPNVLAILTPGIPTAVIVLTPTLTLILDLTLTMIPDITVLITGIPTLGILKETTGIPTRVDSRLRNPDSRDPGN